MRMHQDIRPFPCTVCEQTFRQKAHLQRHEATHGIDSMANRKRRKRPLDENGLELSGGGGDPGKIGIMEGEGEEEEEDDDIAYRPFVEKRKFTPAAVMKTEREEEGGGTDLDPMIEPIVRQQGGSGTHPDTEKRLLCVPVNVGTNTEARQHHVLNDEIEESTLEPVRFREAAPLPPRLIQVEQGVQYCAEDLLQDEEEELDSYGRHQDQDVKYSGGGGDDSRINGMGTSTDEGAASLRDERQGLKCENVEEEGAGDVCHMNDSAAMAGDDEGVVTYSSQEETHYHVTTVEGEDGQQQLIAQTADGSYIDASGSQLVMSADGELVGFVPLDSGGGAQQHSSQVVNISTSTNEHGQQVVIIENLHAHSPELQQEILRALMSDTNLIPLSQA
jgi:hypothetical protein